MHADIRNGQTELVLSRKECSGFHWGTNLVVDPSAKNMLQKYDFGIIGEPVKDFLVGLKHQSLNKDVITPGKMIFYFMNQTEINRFTSEFSYDVAKKTLDTRVGATHKFNPDTMGFLKVNNLGKVDAMLKVKLNN